MPARKKNMEQENWWKFWYKEIEESMWCVANRWWRLSIKFEPRHLKCNKILFNECLYKYLELDLSLIAQKYTIKLFSVEPPIEPLSLISWIF